MRARIRLGRTCAGGWAPKGVPPGAPGVRRAWLGIDAPTAVFVFTALRTEDVATRALSLLALERFAPRRCSPPGVPPALRSRLGLSSRYGLVRFWWVGGEVVLNLVLTALVPARPGAGSGRGCQRPRSFVAGVPVTLTRRQRHLPPIVWHARCWRWCSPCTSRGAQPLARLRRSQSG